MLRIGILFMFLVISVGFAAPTVNGEVLQVDSDYDGKMDQWHHRSDDGKIIKIEFDKNGDGKIQMAMVKGEWRRGNVKWRR